jgi:hypothetical protein
MNVEMIDRLRRTFVEDEKIADLFGTRKSFAIMKTIASTAEALADSEGVEDWTADPWVYDQAVQAANVIFNLLRPPGAVPERNLLSGPAEAVRRLGLVRDAREPSASFEKYGQRLPKMQVSRIKSELGRAQQEAVTRADLDEVAERIPETVEKTSIEELQRLARKPTARKGRKS